MCGENANLLPGYQADRRERESVGKHQEMNGKNPETLNLMIDRSREEVATAMIPNNPYRSIDKRSTTTSVTDPSRCLVTADHASVTD